MHQYHYENYDIENHTEKSKHTETALKPHWKMTLKFLVDHIELFHLLLFIHTLINNVEVAKDNCWDTGTNQFQTIHWLEGNDWIWFCCSANDKNQCTRPAIFSSEQCTNPKGECIVMWKNQRTSALIFVICTSIKSYQSLTSFMHVTWS